MSAESEHDLVGLREFMDLRRSHEVLATRHGLLAPQVDKTAAAVNLCQDGLAQLGRDIHIHSGQLEGIRAGVEHIVTGIGRINDEMERHAREMERHRDRLNNLETMDNSVIAEKQPRRPGMVMASAACVGLAAGAVGKDAIPLFLQMIGWR